jgi:hypothetical protein
LFANEAHPATAAWRGFFPGLREFSVQRGPLTDSGQPASAIAAHGWPFTDGFAGSAQPLIVIGALTVIDPDNPGFA